uniref:Adapter molecule Crk n=1 Tax=Panagrolaimus sp. PS1159 TaxID=55785 RepID=A0AC35GKE8_9BILA
MPSRNSFDPYNFDSYFFGNINREESENILMYCEVGTFILRNSTTQPHGYSLSVRNSMDGPRQIHHYLINSIECKNGVRKLQMHNRTYIDIANLISYFKMTKLEQTHLITPAPRKPMKVVIAEHKFDGQNISDLPFARNEILEILRIPEEGWWVARNSLGMIGFIPSNYVREDPNLDEQRASRKSLSKQKLSSYRKQQNARPFKHLIIPAIVKVVANRTPSVYDSKAMTLKIGQLIHLTKVYANGICFGTNQETGKSGTFPFTYVKWTNEPIINPPSDPPPSSQIKENLPN